MRVLLKRIIFSFFIHNTYRSYERLIIRGIYPKKLSKDVAEQLLINIFPPGAVGNLFDKLKIRVFKKFLIENPRARAGENTHYFASKINRKR